MTPFEFLQANRTIQRMYLQSLDIITRQDFEEEVKLEFVMQSCDLVGDDEI